MDLWTNYPLTDQALSMLESMVINTVLLFAALLFGAIMRRWLAQFIDWFSLR